MDLLQLNNLTESNPPLSPPSLTPAPKKPRQQPASEKASQPGLEIYGTEDNPEDDASDSTQIPPSAQVPNDQLMMPQKAKTLIHNMIAGIREDEVTQTVARTTWDLL